jgi:short-subunit dehydrogenase
MVGLIPLPHMTGYSAAKSGLKGFSDALRRELSNTGVRISHIAPRAVHTAMNSGKLGLLNKRTHATEDRPRDVANRIADAIEHSEADVRIGWPERLFAQLNAVFPALIDKGLRKNTTIGIDILNADHDIADAAHLVAADCDVTRRNIA